MFVAHEDDRFGAPKAMIELIVQLRKKFGITPIVIIPKRNKLVDICIANNIQYRVIPFYEWGHLSTDNRLKILLKKIRKVVINYFAKFIIAYICSRESVEIIHSNVGVIDIGLEVSKMKKVPHIWHIRESGVETEWTHYEANFFKKHNSTNNCNIAISEYVKNNWVKKGISKSKIQVIYDGINNEKFKIKTTETSTPIKMILLGALEPHKGQNELIEAVGKIRNKKNLKIDIVGEGNAEFESCLLSNIDKYNLDDVVSIIKYSNDVPKLLQKYDVGLICSKGEGFGRVTIEYMFTGLPVIASNTGANVEIIKDDVNGKIYNYDDNNDLTEKIIYFTENRNIIKKLGYNGYKYARGKFTIENHASNVYDAYKKMN